MKTRILAVFCVLCMFLAAFGFIPGVVTYAGGTSEERVDEETHLKYKVETWDSGLSNVTITGFHGE